MLRPGRLPRAAVQTTLIAFFDRLVGPCLLILLFPSRFYAKSPDQVYDNNDEGNPSNNSTDDCTDGF